MSRGLSTAAGSLLGWQKEKSSGRAYVRAGSGAGGAETQRGAAAFDSLLFAQQLSYGGGAGRGREIPAH